MIYKSYCSIDIEYYPFDIQNCYFKFGSWTYDGTMINLEHINVKNAKHEPNISRLNYGAATKLYTVETGIDMSDYYSSVEWDVLSVPAQKNIKIYECCPEPYYDIYFNITIRRKTLFYTVNLIIPCVNISFLSVLVFFLPSDSGEKLTLGISILVALLVFYLLLIELIPPTSLVIPLIGKYLLFTLILVNLSILLTIFILNLHHRKPSTHRMPYWMKRLFLNILPKMLMIERPIDKEKSKGLNIKKYELILTKNGINEINDSIPQQQKAFKNDDDLKSYPQSIRDALNGLNYINKRMKKDNLDRKEIDDWKYASMVIDRLLLWIFTAACLIGTLGILLQAPSIYDERKPLGKLIL
jgi:nicotinic acetylcholine receptor